MAIINCPSCKKRISDKAKTCSHCNVNIQSGTRAEELTEEQLDSKAKLARMKKLYSLQMQAMAALILFLLGILLWYFLGNFSLTEVSHFIELGLVVIGGIWYLLTRVRLIIFKKG